MTSVKEWERLLRSEPEPVRLGNRNRTGKCGMCGMRQKQLHPWKVGQVQFYICDTCKSIMEMGRK